MNYEGGKVTEQLYSIMVEFMVRRGLVLERGGFRGGASLNYE